MSPALEEILAKARANADVASQQAAAGVGGNAASPAAPVVPPTAPPAPPIPPPTAPVPPAATAPATPSAPSVQTPPPAPVPAPQGGTMSAMDTAMAQLAAAIQAEMATKAAEKAAADQAAANRLLVAQHLAAQTGHTLVPITPAAPVAEPVAPVDPTAVAASATPVATGTPVPPIGDVFFPGRKVEINGDVRYYWPNSVSATEADKADQHDPTAWSLVDEMVHRLNLKRFHDAKGVKNNVGRIPRLANFKWTL